MTDFICSVDPDCPYDQGAKIAFTVDWRDGTVSEPFLRRSHEENSRPEWVWKGLGSLFCLPVDRVTQDLWDGFLKEASPRIDELRAGFEEDSYYTKTGSFSDDPDGDAHRRFEEWYADYWVHRADDMPAFCSADDYFNDFAAFTDEEGDSCSQGDCVTACFADLEGPREVGARSSDAELDALAAELADWVDTSVAIVSLESIRAWLSDIRDAARGNDPCWGELVPALEALIEAGDPRVRHKAIGPFNPDSRRTILIATHPQPGDGMFEPAELDLSYSAYEQWQRAEIPFPDDIASRIEKVAIASQRRFARTVLDEWRQSGKGESIKAARDELHRIEQRAAELRQRMDMLESETAEARRWCANRASDVLIHRLSHRHSIVSERPRLVESVLDVLRPWALSVPELQAFAEAVGRLTSSVGVTDLDKLDAAVADVAGADADLVRQRLSWAREILA